ncbi:MAG: hypothetical protein N2558_01795 [Patescibacteria group bacterium]|nr:hypothetical protein [Patescibacteria group bacterium]
MGKTKTAFVSGIDNQPVKPSYDKAAKMAKRMAKMGLANADKPIVAQPDTTLTNKDVAKDLTTDKKPSTKKSVKKQRSVKYQQASSKINKNNIYSLSEAISLVKEISFTKFDSTVELHLVVKKQGTNANVTLPHSSGRQKKVEIASDATIEKLKAGKIDFDILLATAEMMPKLVPFAKLLGPRGLMPNPKNGTIIKSEKDAAKFDSNTLSVKTEKSAPVIHTICGKVSQSEKELEENIKAIINAIGVKQIAKAYIKSTMSPSLKFQV